MKDKKIFKKWWFWLIVAVIVIGAIGSLGQSNNSTENTNNTQDKTADSTATLPKLNAEEYRSKEGLVVYKELKSKGYKVDAAFENQALTDINGKASDLFEPLDPNKTDDKQSVDAFIVSNLVQDGDSVTLAIAKSSN